MGVFDWLFGSSQTQNTDTTGSTTPTFGAGGDLNSVVLNMIKKRLSGSGPDMAGYGASGIGNINHTFDLVKQSQANNLTARGLGTSPIAGAVDANRETARGGQIAQFQNSLPLIQREFQNQDFGLAGNALGLNRGATTTSTGRSTTQTSGLDLPKLMGYLIASGAFA